MKSKTLKFHTEFAENMVRPVIGRICISSCGLMLPNSQKALNTYYVRVGPMVLVLSAGRLMTNPVPMLRNTLIAFIACLTALKSEKFVRSSWFQKSTLLAIVKSTKKKYKEYSEQRLLRQIYTMLNSDDALKYLFGNLLKIDCSQNLVVLTSSLIDYALDCLDWHLLHNRSMNS